MLVKQDELPDQILRAEVESFSKCTKNGMEEEEHK